MSFPNLLPSKFKPRSYQETQECRIPPKQFKNPGVLPENSGNYDSYQEIQESGSPIRKSRTFQEVKRWQIMKIGDNSCQENQDFKP